MTLLQRLQMWREHRQAEREARAFVDEIMERLPEWRRELEEMRDARSDV